MTARESRRASDNDTYHHDEELRSALPQHPSPLALISEKEVLTDDVPALPLKDESRGRSRGRSTRRGRGSQERGSTSRSRSRWIHQDCEISWAGYGHRNSDRGEVEPKQPKRSPRPRAREFTEPGFDEVDLELDGDDEREDSSQSVSSGGSFDSAAISRGRTSLRA